MTKTLVQVELQVRQIIGDLAATNFDSPQVEEAVNWAQNLIMRRKGFKMANKLFALGSYPTGTIPSDWLASKRVLLVQYVIPAGVGKTIADAVETDDTVLRVLDESSISLEDSANELWRSQRATFMPRRWTLIGNNTFSAVPPVLPVSSILTSVGVRFYYIQMATPTTASTPLGIIDATIPDYYQEALRYAAVAYLMEKDTDQKSMQLKEEMMKSFEFHLAGGVDKLAVGDQDA